MSTAVEAAPVAAASRRSRFAAVGIDTRCIAVAVLLVAAGAFHLVVFAVDDRPWSGPVSWRKPFTFGEAFGITLATVVWVSRPLHMPRRRRAILLAIFAVDCVVEVTGITVQAWRGVPSHLNTSTPFNTAVAGTLAFGGAVLVVVLGTFAATALRHPVHAADDRVLAIRAGWLFLMAGLLSGAAMIAVGTVAMRTGSPAHAYAVTGFLKAFHGLTIHALVTLPGLAWLMERAGVTPTTRHHAVVAAIALLGVTAAGLLAYEIARV